jgi:hypothetical protein
MQLSSGFKIQGVATRSVKALIAIACLILTFSFHIHSAPPAAATKQTLCFVAYDSEPGKTDPKDITFQIERRDVRHSSQFLKLGDIVANTKFKLTQFQRKVVQMPSGAENDISELTLVNTETKEVIVLIRSSP